MFTTISIHKVISGQKETALDIFKTNTILGRKQQGFISRDIFISVENPMKITTVTSWETKSQLEAWAKNPERPKRDKDASPLFSEMEIVVYEDVKV